MNNSPHSTSYMQTNRELHPLDPILDGKRHCDFCGCALTRANAAPVSDIATHRYCNGCNGSFEVAAAHDAQVDAMALAYAALLDGNDATVRIKEDTPVFPKLNLSYRKPDLTVKPNYFMWVSPVKAFIEVILNVLETTAQSRTQTYHYSVQADVELAQHGTVYFLVSKFPRGTGVERMHVIDDNADITITMHRIEDKWKDRVDTHHAHMTQSAPSIQL